jgi:hypothetical protein
MATSWAAILGAVAGCHQSDERRDKRVGRIMLTIPWSAGVRQPVKDETSYHITIHFQDVKHHVTRPLVVV